MTEKLKLLKGKNVKVDYKIYRNEFRISPKGINFINNEKANYNYLKKNSDLVNKMDALINYLNNLNFDKKEEIISVIKLKKKQNEEYAKNYIAQRDKFILYYKNCKDIIELNERNFNLFIYNKKKINENFMLLDISVNIQIKIAHMYEDLLDNHSKLRELYDIDNQIIDEFCKKYNYIYIN